MESGQMKVTWFSLYKTYVPPHSGVVASQQGGPGFESTIWSGPLRVGSKGM